MTLLEMAKISKRLAEGLLQAWRLRMDQKLPECRASFHTLLKSLKVDPLNLNVEWMKEVDSARLPIFVDALLLKVSLLRADGKIQDAVDTTEELDTFLRKKQAPYPFQFYFQKGNNFLYRGDFSSALECFVKATDVAVSNEEKVLSLSNTLFTLECLGESYGSVYKELKTRLETVPPSELSGVREQFSALEMSYGFREGRFDLVFSRSLEKCQGQEAHLRFLCSELPYHTFHNTISAEEKEIYFTKTPNLHQKGYRMRTLQGMIHASDFEKRVRESDSADRLYLWTWRWLVAPESFSFEKVLILLENTNFREMIPRMTAEDHCLVRNSLLWIAFFVPRHSEELERIAKLMKQPGTGRFPLFDFEKNLVEYLRLEQQKKKEAQNKLATLKAHPLWSSENIQLRTLIEGGEFPSLQSLQSRISEVLNRTESYKKGVVYVDMGRREIVWNGGRKRVISDPICLALDLMRRKECLTFEEFLSVCFGIHRFDSIIHNAKVYNLIARIKEITGPEMVIKTKYGRIYCYGPWENIEFIYPSGGLEDVVRRKDWGSAFRRERAFTPPSREYRPGIVLAGKSDHTVLSRQELESAIGKSRATANRIIQNWVQQGIVKKVGRARNTKYLVLTQSSKLPTEF